MKILFISDNFYPESNAPANRLYDHARVWKSLDHEVVILTCAPNFPAGKVFSGYRNAWKTTETIDGITVIRIKTYIAENKGTLKRMIDYASFGFHAAIQGLFVKSPDVVIGTSPQPFATLAACIVAKLKRKPFIFELRDIWPESILAVGAMKKKNNLLKFFEWMMDCLYRSANMIVTVTDSFRSYLIQEKKIDENKIAVFKNGVLISQIKPTVPAHELIKKYNVENKYVVGYVGTIGMAHGVGTILEAADKMRDTNVQFIVMGGGADAKAVQQIAMTKNNITFIPAGNRQDAVNVTNMLDASIVHLKDTPLFQTVIPSKIFEAMALGKPILMGVRGESRRIVIEDAKAGIAFEPENSDSLQRAILQCQAKLFDAEKIKGFVAQYYDRSVIAMRMIADIGKKLG